MLARDLESVSQSQLSTQWSSNYSWRFLLKENMTWFPLFALLAPIVILPILWQSEHVVMCYQVNLYVSSRLEQTINATQESSHIWTDFKRLKRHITHAKLSSLGTRYTESRRGLLESIDSATVNFRPFNFVSLRHKKLLNFHLRSREWICHFLSALLLLRRDMESEFKRRQ